MIYLIGGAPKTGKTTLAKKLSKTTNIPWISGDILRQIARRYTDPSHHAEMFPINTLRKKMPKNNDKLYTHYSTQELINAYKTQSISTYGAIEIMTISNAEYIIEGRQVTPELVETLQSKYGKKKVIKSIFLSKTNKENLIQGFTKNPSPLEDWIMAYTKDRKRTFPKIADMIAQYSTYFENEAQKHGFKTLNTDSDFDNVIINAISYLINS